MSVEPTEQIVLVIEYEVEVANRPKFLELMAQSCRDTIADEGCRRMELCRPVEGDDGRFVLTELWDNQACIDKHRMRPGHDAQHAASDALVARKRVLKLKSFAVDGWTQAPAAAAP